MPVLRLSTPVKLEATTAAALAKSLTELTAQRLGKRADVTVVHVTTVSPSQWFINGQAPTQATALLEIDITAGTNSAHEKADFIGAAYALLCDTFAPQGTLAAASYVVVRENAATDWGYGGLTQAHRRARRTPSAQP